VRFFPHGVLLGAIDGLGHGEEAAVAARRAVLTLEDYSNESPLTLIKECHEQLRGTRGVVMTLASLSFAYNTISWLGVGNVEGLLLRADARTGTAKQRILSRPGVVGYQLPRLAASELPLAKDDLLVFATDGIDGGFTEIINRQDSAQAIADHICSRFAKNTDDALVLVTRYLGIGL
jgi:serine phosphatase RsbU (regulator of sigma subunit)